MAAVETGKLHIKNGDTVYVISGKERGKTGKVIKILRDENKAIVERLNVIKRHARPSQKNPSGGIIEKEAGIHISNLMLYCSKCKRPSRIGRKRLASGEKVRYCKRCNEEIKG
ncbi:MAG: 50S ribosomal protein L24 [Candidatus Dadabacteria bacterium]